VCNFNATGGIKQSACPGVVMCEYASVNMFVQLSPSFHHGRPQDFFRGGEGQIHRRSQDFL